MSSTVIVERGETYHSYARHDPATKLTGGRDAIIA